MQRALSTAKRGPQPPRPLGTLLGDDCAGAQASASIPLTKGKSKLHVKFAQNIAKADYIQHLYSVFYNFVGSAKPTSAITEYSWGPTDLRGIDNVCGFELRASPAPPSAPMIHSSIQSMNTKGAKHSEARPTAAHGPRKKRVPPKIHELLTPRGLAYWFIPDGTYAKRAHHRIYRFSTHSSPGPTDQSSAFK